MARRRRRRCPPGHHWDRAEKRCVATHPKPTTTTTTTPAAGLEPVAGTLTPAVAQAGDTGTSEAPGGGDLTGTAALQDAVFSQGSGYAPQYHYDLQPQQAEVTAQNMTSQSGGQ